MRDNHVVYDFPDPLTKPNGDVLRNIIEEYEALLRENERLRAQRNEVMAILIYKSYAPPDSFAWGFLEKKDRGRFREKAMSVDFEETMHIARRDATLEAEEGQDDGE